MQPLIASYTVKRVGYVRVRAVVATLLIEVYETS